MSRRPVGEPERTLYSYRGIGGFRLMAVVGCRCAERCGSPTPSVAGYETELQSRGSAQKNNCRPNISLSGRLMRRKVLQESENSKRNALRHSYGSYRVALVQDPRTVAFEMGNSAQMVMRHYREVVTPEEGRAWFGIVPPVAEKVVPFTNAVAVGLRRACVVQCPSK